MSIPQLFSGNADIKYPLSDFHEHDIPNDILLDISLSVPPGMSPGLGVLRVGPSTAFLVIEDQDTGLPLASVNVVYPLAAQVYPLDMDVPGWGWVVLGPRAVSGEPYYSGPINIDLDPETSVSLLKTAPGLALEVNGFPYEVSNILDLVEGSDALIMTSAGPNIFIDRNDDVLAAEDLVALNVATEDSDLIRSQLLYTIANTPPDAFGNIDIILSGCIQDCGAGREMVLPKGDLAVAESRELPLDLFAEQAYIAGGPLCS